MIRTLCSLILVCFLAKFISIYTKGNTPSSTLEQSCTYPTYPTTIYIVEDGTYSVYLPEIQVIAQRENPR